MDTITCYIAVLTVYFFVRLFGCLIQHLMGDVEFAETLQDKAEAEEGEWLIFRIIDRLILGISVIVVLYILYLYTFVFRESQP